MIDPARLPARAMLDNNVLSFALGAQPNRPEAKACVELWEALIDHKREIYIATPTLAEWTRGNPGAVIPTVQYVHVVAFDRRAAQVLGTALPSSVLKQVADPLTGISKTHLKFDTLILACAARWATEYLVTFDPDMAKLQAQDQTGDLAKLKIVNPYHFQVPQPVLNLTSTGGS